MQGYDGVPGGCPEPLGPPNRLSGIRVRTDHGPSVRGRTAWQRNPFEVYAVDFAPDGASLATAGSSSTVNLWVTSAEELSELECETVWRNLSLAEWTQLVGPSVPYALTCPNLPPGDGAS